MSAPAPAPPPWCASRRTRPTARPASRCARTSSSPSRASPRTSSTTRTTPTPCTCSPCGEDGGPLGTGRLLHGAAAAAKTGGDARSGSLGRLAVTAAARGLGVGAALVRAIEDAARARGLTAVDLHAQTHALGFYERLGYAAYGPEFPDAGISAPGDAPPARARVGPAGAERAGDRPAAVGVAGWRLCGARTETSPERVTVDQLALLFVLLLGALVSVPLGDRLRTARAGADDAARRSCSPLLALRAERRHPARPDPARPAAAAALRGRAAHLLAAVRGQQAADLPAGRRPGLRHHGRAWPPSPTRSCRGCRSPPPSRWARWSPRPTRSPRPPSPASSGCRAAWCPSWRARGCSTTSPRSCSTTWPSPRPSAARSRPGRPGSTWCSPRSSPSSSGSRSAGAPTS